ncbi:hypothetical protein [Asaia prunellae]|uniref:hypothetical protein n=1 Tax=Asaia prunellae TaxID=610245 RepID=UPI0004706B71|nr:hypothetical protein [Asaia prunellae]
MIQNEQKPDSAEFRTLDKMVDEIQERLIDLMLERCYPDYSEIMGWLTEAEARGAAEQRRKDAEGAEPVGYVSRRGLEQLTAGKGASSSVQSIYRNPDNSWPIPLYTCPANVAALEARVKELEAEVKEEQRISNLRAEAIDNLTNRCAAMEQEKHEAVAEERERCAKLCEGISLENLWQRIFSCGEKAISDTYEARAKDAAADIREGV